MEYKEEGWRHLFAWDGASESGRRTYGVGRVALAIERPSGRVEVAVIVGIGSYGTLFVPMDRIAERVWRFDELDGAEEAAPPVEPLFRTGEKWELA